MAEIHYRPEVIESLRKYARESAHPDNPILLAGDLEMSLNDYLEQVEKKTDIGIAIYNKWERQHDSKLPKKYNYFI